MKKVRFRVWQTFHKKMLTVTDLHFDKNGNIKGVTVRNTPDTIPTIISYGLEKDFGLTYEGKETLVLMQSTNLKDKNGKEIYEGDIIEYKHYHIIIPWWKDLKHKKEIEKMTKKKRKSFSKNRCVVTFEDGEFKFAYGVRGYNIKINNFIHNGLSYTSDYKERCWDFEVIGNIYENPELLKEDKNEPKKD